MNDIDYDPFDQMTFTYDKCFLCGQPLNNQNKTKEHIFPKWLQNKFDLWDKSLSLLNGTIIKYKNLTIPCCKNCNEIMSAKIEKPMQEAVENGCDYLKNINQDIIFLWLNKIAYGVLFKELSLKIDRKNNSSKTIFGPDEIRERRMQYLFLKSIICDTNFHNKPYSILIFKVKNEKLRYWAWDNPFLHTFCIQMNDIGIISHLMDNGYNEGYFKNFEVQRKLLEHELHPVQFLEVCAQFTYKCSLFYREPFYTTVFIDGKQPVDIISHNVSGMAYNEWNNEEYAQIFEHLLKDNGYILATDSLQKKDGLRYTTLFADNGEFNDIELNEI